jgi:hypothetical protein
MECGSENANWCTDCPVCGGQKRYDIAETNDHSDDIDIRVRSIEALAQEHQTGLREGTWMCHECDAPNSEINVTCGSCGARGDGTSKRP